MYVCKLPTKMTMDLKLINKNQKVYLQLLQRYESVQSEQLECRQDSNRTGYSGNKKGEMLSQAIQW